MLERLIGVTAHQICNSEEKLVQDAMPVVEIEFRIKKSFNRQREVCFLVSYFYTILMKSSFIKCLAIAKHVDGNRLRKGLNTP